MRSAHKETSYWRPTYISTKLSHFDAKNIIKRKEEKKQVIHIMMKMMY